MDQQFQRDCGFQPQRQGKQMMLMFINRFCETKFPSEGDFANERGCGCQPQPLGTRSSFIRLDDRHAKTSYSNRLQFTDKVVDESPRTGPIATDEDP